MGRATQGKDIWVRGSWVNLVAWYFWEEKYVILPQIPRRVLLPPVIPRTSSSLCWISPLATQLVKQREALLSKPASEVTHRSSGTSTLKQQQEQDLPFQPAAVRPPQSLSMPPQLVSRISLTSNPSHVNWNQGHYGTTSPLLLWPNTTALFPTQQPCCFSSYSAS